MDKGDIFYISHAISILRKWKTKEKKSKYFFH